MKEIIMTRIFPNSEYLQEGNIGHEIINLFADDDNRKYIYLMPGGDYAYEHKENEIDAILIVRGINANCVEVIAKATGLKPVFEPTKERKSATETEFRKMGELIANEGIENITPDSYISLIRKSGSNEGDQYEKRIGKKLLCFNNDNKKQIEYIKENNICYGGVLLNKLFSKNTTDKYGLSIYITFEADKVQMAKKPFYLYIGEEKNRITENDCKLSERERLAGSALTTYYLENTKDYKDITEKVIGQNDLWGNEISNYTPPKINEDDFTFFNVIKKVYDELSFSNMFAYYFDKYPKLLEYFLNNVKTTEGKRIANKDFEFKSKPEICREEKNIDILIKADSLIIIENKIKSAINGKKHDIHGELVGTQLSKYYDYVVETYSENPICLIFSPDYNKINTENIKENMGEKYSIIQYSEIHRVIDNFYKNNESTFDNDKYFTDFLKAVKYHSAKDDNRFEEISKRKLKELIEQVQ